MGKEIAKEFKSIYPEMFSLYQQKCEDSQFDIGQLMLYRTANKATIELPHEETLEKFIESRVYLDWAENVRTELWRVGNYERRFSPTGLWQRRTRLGDDPYCLRLTLNDSLAYEALIDP